MPPSSLPAVPSQVWTVQAAAKTSCTIVTPSVARTDVWPWVQLKRTAGLNSAGHTCLSPQPPSADRQAINMCRHVRMA
eukprot:CAMPEP_0202858102 /NCGR_PEP_ID=MMETSP1391-20130828/774_1 /ASSEMBLY_ACC=CAM_ASM_000867 /TAXON_ID=1034604 /ORGANISM="Chlamydomonas leiostraca, Strain SAG 11-49" /LENGTH=77 /DNA_ID=CAMNT_0049536983 /DNA_START=860 /DNA_END=1093 /DNA_ORIENTATION=+